MALYKMGPIGLSVLFATLLAPLFMANTVMMRTQLWVIDIGYMVLNLIELEYP